MSTFYHICCTYSCYRVHGLYRLIAKQAYINIESMLSYLARQIRISAHLHRHITDRISVQIRADVVVRLIRDRGRRGSIQFGCGPQQLRLLFSRACLVCVGTFEGWRGGEIFIAIAVIVCAVTSTSPTVLDQR